MSIPATWLISIEGLVGRSLHPIGRSLVPALVVILGLVCLASSSGHGREIESYAIVRDDASLRIQGRNLRLFGIFIPDTGRVCGKTLPACGSRAAIALDALLEGRVRPLQAHGGWNRDLLCPLHWSARWSRPGDASSRQRPRRRLPRSATAVSCCRALGAALRHRDLG
jgi:hypothetical protein